MKGEFDQERIGERFDKEAPVWRQIYVDGQGCKSRYNNKQYRKHYVLEMVGEGSGCILDLGCGTGQFFRPLASLGYSVVGADYSANMLEFAKTEVKGCREADIVRANALTLPFKSRSFDHLIAVGLLEYLPNDNDVLEEIKRIVKPGGTAVITLRNQRCLERKLWTLFWKLRIKKRREPYYYREHDPVQFKSLVSKKGLLLCEERLCHFYPLPWPISSFFNALNNYLAHHMERVFSRSGRYALASTLIIRVSVPADGHR